MMPLLVAEETQLEDPGIAFILTKEQRAKAEQVMKKVFAHFFGEWVGDREGEDTGNQGFVPSTRRYYTAMGGPQVWCLVTAGDTDESAFFTDITETEARHDSQFYAGKTMFYSFLRDNVLTYFFEDGGNVQIFELDKEATHEKRLVWQEILRAGNLFRVVETITDDERLIVTIYRQDDQGKYQVYSKGTSRRNQT
jgi:hypothetical protein